MKELFCSDSDKSRDSPEQRMLCFPGGMTGSTAGNRS